MSFCGKDLFSDKRARVRWTINALNISDILNGVAAAWRLKIGWNNFVGKNLIVGLFGESDQNRVLWAKW